MPARNCVTVPGSPLTPRGRRARSAKCSWTWPRPGNSSATQVPSPTTRTEAPTSRNAGLVTTPAARRARPSESTRGAAVGLGISTESSPAVACGSGIVGDSLDIPGDPPNPRCGEPLPPDQVDHGEDHDPDAVHEVPVPRHELDREMVGPAQLPPECQPQHDQHRNHPEGHMHPVE